MSKICLPRILGLRPTFCPLSYLHTPLAISLLRRLEQAWKGLFNLTTIWISMAIQYMNIHFLNWNCMRKTGAQIWVSFLALLYFAFSGSPFCAVSSRVTFIWISFKLSLVHLFEVKWMMSQHISKTWWRKRFIPSPTNQKCRIYWQYDSSMYDTSVRYKFMIQVHDTSRYKFKIN